MKASNVRTKGEEILWQEYLIHSHVSHGTNHGTNDARLKLKQKSVFLIITM